MCVDKPCCRAGGKKPTLWLQGNNEFVRTITTGLREVAAVLDQVKAMVGGVCDLRLEAAWYGRFTQE